MTVYKHILFATDLRPDTWRAMEKTLAIAQLCNAELSVLHILAASNITMSGEMIVPVTGLDELQSDAMVQLNAFGNRFKIPEKNRYLSCGDNISSIVRFAEQLSADLIVLGLHQYGLINYLFGATAEKILKRTPCDVLSVRVE